MNWLKYMVTRFYGYHHTIAILIQLNWFGQRLEGITTATLVEMCLEWKPWKKMWEESLEKVCSFCSMETKQRHALSHKIHSSTNLVEFCYRM
jgi:hypothetical protein